MEFKNATIEELHAFVAGKRDELQSLRFSSSGSKTRNVKLASQLRKDIARALTQVNAKR